MSEFKDWYNGIPLFTRYWLTAVVVLSILGTFEFIDPFRLILDYDQLVNGFQFWRLATATVYHRTGWTFLINCYFLYSYSSRLETGVYAGKPADYLFMLLFNWLCCIIVGLIARFHVLLIPSVMSVLYVWCQLNKDVIVSFWFGSRFKAMYLPWVLFVFNLILGGHALMDLAGIVIGHLYFFLVFKYPQEFGGPALISTPSILKHWFPNTRVMGGFGSAPQARGSTAGPAGGATGGGVLFNRGHNWGGGGHTLGRD